ncbi:uncharacterized protein LOC135386398 [Ornithodoros turicata]|uniref:uncharacterized protein LOC135386398 n=1 Tax=Ornithodoros turicata TaxID=34597 RepID=UPI00313A07D4
MFNVTKRIIVKADLEILVFFNERCVQMPETSGKKAVSGSEVTSILKTIDEACVCPGVKGSSRISDKCTGYYMGAESTSRGPKIDRCIYCRLDTTKQKNTMRRQKHAVKSGRGRPPKSSRKKLNQQRIRLRKTVVKLHQKVNHLREKCANLSNETVEAALTSLPDSQKEAVRQCFANAKRKGPQGRRYTLEWVYECLLMRIKSPALYKHLRSKDLLPLPCVDTLNNYINKVKGIYGFQESVFECIKIRSAAMAPEDKHGMLYYLLYYGMVVMVKGLAIVGLTYVGNDRRPAECASWADF